VLKQAAYHISSKLTNANTFAGFDMEGYVMENFWSILIMAHENSKVKMIMEIIPYERIACRKLLNPEVPACRPVRRWNAIFC
jgi:hypothetical protein